ncbi:MAG TPA: hypothetical protein VN419_14195 [Humidesulfovibrio sp.]|uniref:hypothetical protein n=1 Tax=Humidesulfovibrio sp. TaxID=2910988 RepID=UPI002C1E2FFC|nr:hypothetical protein [Humidesulfovibrio sp.]HWR05153.1 hypothetical protein [Humidesulfovibrio sp.]
MAHANHNHEALLPLDLFRVYEVTDPFHAAPYRLTLRLAREKRLLEDISSGRKLLRLGRMVLETRELALARAQSQAMYL